MNELFLYGLVPAILIVLAGLIILQAREPERGRRRFLLYLLAVAVLLLLVLSVAALISPRMNNQLAVSASGLLLPALLGVLTLILLDFRRLRKLEKRARTVVVFLILALVGLLALLALARFEFLYFGVYVVPALLIAWSLGRRSARVAVYLSLFALAALLLFNLSWSNPELSTSGPAWLWIPVRVTYFLLPGLSVGLAAVLLTAMLQRSDDLQRARGGRRPAAFLKGTLVLLLLGGLAYTIFWGSVWDQTSDGLSGLFFSMPSILTGIAAGMVMAIRLTGRRRLAGIVFAGAVPLLMIQAFDTGWDISYHDLTAARARRIETALQGYEQREGRYPETLQALVPRDLLWLPRPVELRGESWCYQGGEEFYRLGAFFREYFSMPVELQLYAAAGEPDSVWACEGQLAAMKERYYSPMEDPQGMQPPPPTPLPASGQAAEAEVLSPLLDDGNTVWGSWSPDGAYFLLGRQDEAGNATLSFLAGPTGKICAAAGTYAFRPHTVSLSPYHAWLAEDRLLLLGSDGQMVLLTPCAPGAQTMTVASDPPPNEIVARSEVNSRLLLKSDEEYWIFDGRSLAWQPIAGVTPNPYEAHWDNAAWQPNGDLLAIARLNGRDASDGSTLYLIAGGSGEVIHSLPLTEASDQSAPRIDWLSPQELLLSGSGSLRILDFEAGAPRATDVMADIFGLDLAFPGEIWGNGWQVDWDRGDYTLLVWANHPRNQSLYVYDSATGTVDVYDEGPQLLLRFANGELEQWAKEGAERSEPDHFTLIDLGTGQVYATFTVDGHTPRAYPRLSVAYLAAADRLAVASSQGVSLHTLPDGEMTHFWSLTGEGFSPFLRPAPDGSALVAIRDRGSIYRIPLP